MLFFQAFIVVDSITRVGTPILLDEVRDATHANVLLERFRALKKYILENSFSQLFVAQRKSARAILSLTEQSLEQLRNTIL